MKVERVHIAICDPNEATLRRHHDFTDAIARVHGVNASVRTYTDVKSLLFDMEDEEDITDVILLDAQAETFSGIEAAEKLKKLGFTGAIVFFSNTDEYVFDAFDVGAFNYLLEREGDDKADRGRPERVLIAACNSVAERRRRHLVLNGISEHCSIPIDSIRYFESRKHVCVVHYGDGEEFEFISPLTKVEDMLLQYGFLRIHRSFVVNCEEITRYSFGQCTLADGTELPIGRRRYAELKTVMEQRCVAQC